MFSPEDYELFEGKSMFLSFTAASPGLRALPDVWYWLHSNVTQYRKQYDNLHNKKVFNKVKQIESSLAEKVFSRAWEDRNSSVALKFLAFCRDSIVFQSNTEKSPFVSTIAEKSLWPWKWYLLLESSFEDHLSKLHVIPEFLDLTWRYEVDAMCDLLSHTRKI